MKKAAFAVLPLLCLFLLFPALAGAEQVTYANGYGKITVDENAAYIDLGSLKVPNRDGDYRQFKQFLAKLPSLEKVDMFATEIPKNRIEELAAAFPNVDFGWTMVIPCVNESHPERGTHRIRTDATAFSTLHNNSCTMHTAEDFSILKYCKNLQALDIGHNLVTDLSFLYDLPHLKVLIVACNLTLTDITPIGSLKELQYLEMFKNRVQDISCLANCTELVDLNICFNSIKDWSPLYGLTKLRRLWLYNSNSWNFDDTATVPAQEVRALREALPDCKIDSIHWSTDGGWRDGHPRYVTVNAMFWAGEYMPFTTLD